MQLDPAFLSGSVSGYLGYLIHRDQRAPWGGPFNGQTERRAIFADLLQVVKPDLIVETGTYLAVTTAHLAESGVPVLTIESSARYYGAARAALRGNRNVDSRFGDSRTQLRRLFADQAAAGTAPRLLVYLDAHWEQDLPLAEEISIIYGSVNDAVVLIDDFQVPDDAGYGYDDYGPGKALTPAYIAPALAAFDLVTLYPALPSDRESGFRRGCVVLCTRATADRLVQNGRLREIAM